MQLFARKKNKKWENGLNETICGNFWSCIFDLHPQRWYSTYTIIDFLPLPFRAFPLSPSHTPTHTCQWSHTLPNGLLRSNFVSQTKKKQDASPLTCCLCVPFLSVLRCSPLTMNVMCFESCSRSACWGKLALGPRGGKSQHPPQPERRTFFSSPPGDFNPSSFAKWMGPPSVASWSC